MLNYSGGGSGGEGWTAVNVVTVHRAVPGPGQLAAIPVSPGIAIWTPPSPGLVRAFMINDDSTDAITANGGATTLAIGVLFGGAAVAALIPATAFSTYSIVPGWGTGAPTVAVTAPGIQDAGVLVFPLGAAIGRVIQSRPIVAFTNAGTGTGTLRFRFEFRPFIGPWT